ncbi:MAG: hypothetical protein ABIP31_01050 [Chitinophagaceae bacterium]
MKKVFLFSALLMFVFASQSVLGQNMATKKIIAKYAADYIPEFKESLAYRSGNPALAKIDVDIDFGSFGDNYEELDLAVRQLHQLKGAILFLAKDATGKEAIEKGLKKITIRKTSDVGKKEISISNGNLLLATNSFDLKTLISTSEIQKFLETKL